MKCSWERSATERFIDDTIYEKEKYYKNEAKPYKVKKVYFTFLAEDEEGNEREFKEHEITTETKETVLLHLRQSGLEVEEHPNHIVLNPGTETETGLDALHFTNHFLFNERNENDMTFALSVATRITDEFKQFKEWVEEQKEEEIN